MGDAQRERGLADAGWSDEGDDAVPLLQRLVDRGQIPGPARQTRRGGQFGLAARLLPGRPRPPHSATW
ncbi:hypothetical protein ACFQ51_37965 [Streptomyces kaempferi]